MARVAPRASAAGKTSEVSPKPLLDKLGVKPGMVISTLGPADAALASQARARSAKVSAGRLVRGSHLVFLFADSLAGLGRVKAARAAIQQNGAIWVIFSKGRPTLGGDQVRAVAFANALVDVKVVSYSPTQTGLKLVIRLADRRKI